MDNIRNFSIIAHIDHGKSTLADRFLELTSTVEKRKMREQYLDQMDLERERGITIKMQPVRMIYKVNHAEIRSAKSEARNPAPSRQGGRYGAGKLEIQNSNDQNSFEFRNSNFAFTNSEYILNLIDTPGHIDFSYEVSRSLAAVEGAVLLVDATKGVQAQTLANVEMAKEAGLVIVPAINKIDLPHAQIKEVKEEIIDLLSCKEEDIFEISAKTGQGVEALLKQIIKKVPSPDEGIKQGSRALIFDFEYSEHKGIIAYVRVFDGEIKKGDEFLFNNAGEKFVVQGVGIFTPVLKAKDSLTRGEIGYVATGIKKPELVRVGDTILSLKSFLPPLPGYKNIKPLVWASIYPASSAYGRRGKQDDFDALKVSLGKLRLSDSSFSYEEESSAALGRGFKCGFLGLLHIEIIVERIKRESGIDIVVASPTVSYKVELKSGEIKNIYSPSEFPQSGEIKSIKEPWVEGEILTPPEKLSDTMILLKDHGASVGETEKFGSARMKIYFSMPLRELMRDFFDKLKSATSGFASLSYEMLDMRPAEVEKIDILVHEEEVSAFSAIVAKKDIQRVARNMVEKLAALMPRALFAFKVQARVGGRIIASRAVSALKKDVTGHLYGGDITRKRKLWAKQKKGKKRLREGGAVQIPHEVFVKMIKR